MISSSSSVGEFLPFSMLCSVLLLIPVSSASWRSVSFWLFLACHVNISKVSTPSFDMAEKKLPPQGESLQPIFPHRLIGSRDGRGTCGAIELGQLQKYNITSCEICQ